MRAGRLSLVLATLALTSLGACRGGATRAPETAPSAAPSVPAPTETTVAEASAAAYPATTSQPTPALAPDIQDLPTGAVAEIDAAQPVDLREPGARYHLVPIHGDGGDDVAVVRSTTQGSSVRATLGALVGAPVTSAAPRHAYAAEVVAESGAGRLLVVFGNRPDNPAQVRAVLPLGDLELPLASYDTKVTWYDWTGDGREDPILEYVPAGSDTPADEAAIVYALPETGLVAARAAKMTSDDVLADAVAGGADELVTPAGAEAWDVASWTGTSFEPGGHDELGAWAPSPVTPDGLPRLPADLIFLKDNALWRWPRAGGALARLAGGDGETAWWYAVAPSARRVMVAVEPATGGAVLRVVDFDGATVGELSTGDAVPWGSPETGNAGLSSDGELLMFLDEADCSHAPTPAAGAPTCAGAWHLSHAASGKDGGFFAPCTALPDAGITIGCTPLAMAPAGQRVAWGDDDGLWVAELPDGQPERLAQGVTGAPGEAKPAPGVDLAPGHVLHEAYGWSPDGRWLITNGRREEGSSLYLWDVDQRIGYGAIPGGDQYQGRSEVAWGVDGPSSQLALIVATSSESETHVYVVRPGGGPLVGEDLLAPPPTWSPGGPALVFGSGIDSAGEPVFGQRYSAPSRWNGSGVFAAAAGGGTSDPSQRAVRRLASLPAVELGEAGNGLDTLNPSALGTLAWAPGGAFAFQRGDLGPGQSDAPWWIGVDDGATVYDAGAVLEGAVDLRWAASIGGG